MIGEIWTYRATKPNDDIEKVRPILIIRKRCGKWIEIC